MAIEQIDPNRVVPIGTLNPRDQVRATLTTHGVFGVPIAEPKNQLEGQVVATFRDTTGIWGIHLELTGEVKTHSIHDNWTVELIQPALKTGDGR